MFQLDVDNAFARSDIDHEVFVEQPHGFVQLDKNGRPYVCKLNKGLYGTKQAARLWNQRMKKFLLSEGWLQFESDPCIFMRKTDRFGLQLLGLYVDDIVHCCESERAHNHLWAKMHAEFPTKNQGKLDYILGMEVKRDRKNKILTLDHSVKIAAFLEQHNATDLKPTVTPMDSNWKYGDGAVVSQARQEEYRSKTCTILFWSQTTRPDLASTVNTLCRHLNNPNEACEAALHHLMRYLAGSVNKGLRYDGKLANALELQCFADATFGGEDAVQGRSTAGYVCYFGGGPISWGTHLEIPIALSSAEAELIAAFNASRVVVYHRDFLEELGVKQYNETVIWEDNEARIAMSKNPVNHKRCKHILIKYHYLRELCDQGIVALKYVSTRHQVADLLTKAVTNKVFLALVDHLVVC